MPGETKTAAQLAEEIKSANEKAIDKVKEIATDALGKAQAGEALAQSVKDTADEALLKLNELQGLQKQFQEMQQKLDRGAGGGELDRGKSIGQLFVESDQVKAFLDTDDRRGKVGLTVKAAITSSVADAAGAAGAAVAETRIAGIVPQGERRMTIRDLIMPGQMDGNSIEFVQETGFTNNAAPVAEGALKPQSDIQLELVSTSAKVLAHTAKVSRQIMDDVSMLRSYLDGRMTYGLKLKEEGQLLNGDGTGQNLNGIVPQATAFSAPFTPAASTMIDTMRLAMLQAALAEYPATAHVMNPIDWTYIETLKDGEGRYLIGNPQGTLSPTLWGLPVVATQAMTVDKFLTGAFDMGAQLFDRWAARVEIATQNEDDFVKNMLTLLCEERLALAVYRPESFIYGDLGRVA